MATKSITNRPKNTGLFRTTSKTLQAGLNSTAKIAGAIETGVDIAVISLQVSKAETIAESILELEALGYSSIEAKEICQVA